MKMDDESGYWMRPGASGWAGRMVRRGRMLNRVSAVVSYLTRWLDGPGWASADLLTQVASGRLYIEWACWSWTMAVSSPRARRNVPASGSSCERRGGADRSGGPGAGADNRSGGRRFCGAVALASNQPSGDVVPLSWALSGRDAVPDAHLPNGSRGAGAEVFQRRRGAGGAAVGALACEGEPGCKGRELARQLADFFLRRFRDLHALYSDVVARHRSLGWSAMNAMVSENPADL